MKTPDPRLDATCLVAEVGGVPITMKDVAELDVSLEIRSNGGASTRLAVDSALALWAEAGSIASSSARERLQAYYRVERHIRQTNTLPGDSARTLKRTMRTLGERANLHHGPCFVQLQNRRSEE